MEIKVEVEAEKRGIGKKGARSEGDVKKGKGKKNSVRRYLMDG